ncbi:hypothetical protein [Zongyangia hominis]|uniref:Uncharacterized protein n=1 Tax=Zongyangia hominis TaxID=2763677 RepID=A0A926IBV9_9FIRM|nr:hypothetical protein [Zongyangia hominis]MBC8570587.1 hypothetical protein [Zongyangia hominis]
MKKQLTAGRIAGYLFCLSLICMAVCGVSYARYASSVNGSAIATVAAVAGEMRNTAIDVSGMQPGDTKTVEFAVANYSGGKTSEVAQEYTVTVKTSGNLPFTFTLTPKAGTENPAGSLKNTSGVWKSTAGFLPAAEQTTHSYTLTITWPAGQTAPDYMDEIDTVTLIVDV